MTAVADMDFRGPRRIAGLFGLLLLAAGCSSTVAVDSPTIPRPNVDPLPLDVAVRIPDNFKNFVHEENVLGRESWTIQLGSANADFFEQLFGYMFDSVTVIGESDDANEFEFDALIEPTIEGFEFSVPSQSKTEAFAVWVRYRMQIYDREGTDAGIWTVSAYGKSQKEGMGGQDSLSRAAVLAMRDAAALILLQMDKATKISALADGPLNADAPPAFAENQLATDGGVGIFAIGGIGDED